MSIIDEQRLENAALHYLERYQCSVASLRRVLLRRVGRWIWSAVAEGTADETTAEEGLSAGRSMIEALIDRYIHTSVLNDTAFVAARTASLHRRGQSTRGIAASLRAKGVDPDLIAAQLASDDAALRPGGDLAAAVALARRRRLGPYRQAVARSDFERKDLAVLCRAGFDLSTARRVLGCVDDEAAALLVAEATDEARCIPPT